MWSMDVGVVPFYHPKTNKHKHVKWIGEDEVRPEWKRFYGSGSRHSQMYIMQLILMESK